MRSIAALSAFASALVLAQEVPVPPKPDGYMFPSRSNLSAPVQLEGHFDVTCPDCRATWPVIQAVLQRYDSSQVAFTLHLFPLPYHVYGFIASQSMHAVAAAGKDPFAWLEAVFAAQEQFGNDATANMTAVQVEDAMGKLAEQTPGVNIPRAAMVADLHSSALDQATRISWKLSCSRGVSGTPTFFANGARLAAGPSWTVRQWMALIDQVLA